MHKVTNPFLIVATAIVEFDFRNGNTQANMQILYTI